MEACLKCERKKIDSKDLSSSRLSNALEVTHDKSLNHHLFMVRAVRDFMLAGPPSSSFPPPLSSFLLPPPSCSILRQHQLQALDRSVPRTRTASLAGRVAQDQSDPCRTPIASAIDRSTEQQAQDFQCPPPDLNRELQIRALLSGPQLHKESPKIQKRMPETVPEIMNGR